MNNQHLTYCKVELVVLEERIQHNSSFLSLSHPGSGGAQHEGSLPVVPCRMFKACRGLLLTL
jgi:hypothetical protein